MKKELGIAILLLVLCVALAILRPAFYGTENFVNMLQRIGMFSILAIGAGVVIITGGIDLTVGSVFALQGVLLCMMINPEQNPWPWPVGVAVSLGALAVLGTFHGFLITKVRLQPFIVTLCGLLIYRSLARVVTDDHSKGLSLGENPERYGWLFSMANGRIPIGHGYEIPSAFIVLLVVAAIMYVVVHRSVYGRYLFAVGRSEEAARYSGINTKLIIGSAYVVSMLLAGISGILLMFYTESVTPSNYGNAYEMYGIAAAVVGGCSLQGGEGSILGIVLGTALIQLLLNLVQMMGIKSTWELAVMGAVILVAVMTDQVFRSKSGGFNWFFIPRLLPQREDLTKVAK